MLVERRTGSAFFFFQAEDGIRDLTVTGVQTCALPIYDGRVTGAAAAVGDDRGGALHDRLPVRIGHVGDQHVAALHARHLARVADDARGSGADALADAA